MNKNEFLKIVSKQIHFFLDREKIEKELSDHIEDSTLDLMEEGYSEIEAQKLAVFQMGNPIEIGQQLNRQHHPVIGYCWLLSTLLSICLFISSIPYAAEQVKGLWNMSHPVIVKDSEMIAKLDIKADIPSHHFLFDELYLTEDDMLIITYRVYHRLNYSRRKNISSYFDVLDSNGVHRPHEENNQSTLIGDYGTLHMNITEDKSIILQLKNGAVVTIHLEDYGL